MDFKKRAKGAFVVVVVVAGSLVFSWPKYKDAQRITTTSLSLLHTEAEMRINKLDQMSQELYKKTTC
jgi:hypothetical protein